MVHTMGGAAGEVLENAACLTVVAAFDHSFYVGDEHGRLVCFLGRDREPGPLHALCDGLPERMNARIHPGDEASRCDSLLAWPGMACDFSAASIWKPEEFPSATTSDIRIGMDAAARILPAFAPRHSLPGVLFCRTGNGDDVDPVQRVLRKEVAFGLAALSECLVHPTPRSDSAALSLLGLGPGLTPSGDDILAGSLLAMHALGRPDAAARLACAMAGLMAEKTNQISAAHLDAAGKGQGAAVFHDFLAALFAGGDFPALFLRIGKIGHTSGWDVLLGILWTVRAFLESVP